jgi:hypothetical protein
MQYLDVSMRWPVATPRPCDLDATPNFDKTVADENPDAVYP